MAPRVEERATPAPLPSMPTLEEEPMVPWADLPSEARFEPPRRVEPPKEGSLFDLPSTSHHDSWTSPPEPAFQPTTPWRTPALLELPPIESAWRRARSLVPVPTVDYRHGFDIVPGEAYGPVPLYVDRDRPWKLHEVDIPVRRKIHFYRTDVNDPRMSDFRIEVVPMNLPPPPPPTKPAAALSTLEALLEALETSQDPPQGPPETLWDRTPMASPAWLTDRSASSSPLSPTTRLLRELFGESD